MPNLGETYRDKIWVACKSCGKERWVRSREIPKTGRCNKCHIKREAQIFVDRQRNATHCQRGHEFSGWNTYIREDGRRYCKTCNNFRHLELNIKERIAYKKEKLSSLAQEAINLGINPEIVERILNGNVQ